jgi:hypothetical protein
LERGSLERRCRKGIKDSSWIRESKAGVDIGRYFPGQVVGLHLSVTVTAGRWG